MTSPPSLHWHVIRTIPVHRVEFAVLYALLQLEVPAMVPFEERWIVRRRKNHRIKQPWFPAYVFAGLRHPAEFPALKARVNDMAERQGKRPPIAHLIGYGRTPAVLSETDVQFLQGLSVEAPTEVNLHKSFRPGSEIKITDGPFSGHTATVSAVTRKWIEAKLRLFGAMVPVKIEHVNVQAA